MNIYERVNELFIYEPETGIFRRKIDSRYAKAGTVAGCLSTQGYWRLWVDGKHQLAHRIAFLFVNGRLPNEQIDHINGIKTDNRIANLREVSNQENGRNRKRQSNNKSGVNGVCWDAKRNRWQARITASGVNKHLGYFLSFEEAQQARSQASRKHSYHPFHGRTA
jgi:hypothetical protein